MPNTYTIFEHIITRWTGQVKNKSVSPWTRTFNKNKSISTCWGTLVQPSPDLVKFNLISMIKTDDGHGLVAQSP